MPSPPNSESAPSAALIVLNWNGRGLLHACLSALFASDYDPFDVIVVDNGSEDDSVEIVREQFPQAIVLPLSRNLGFPRGMNAGFRHALKHGYDILVSVNNDVVVPPEWLQALVNGLMAADDIGLAGSKLLYPDRRTIQHAGGGVSFPRGMTYHFHQHEEDRGQAGKAVEVPYVTGAAMAVRAAVLQDIGLFDESFGPFYFEEADLCFRARAAGWRVMLAPEATAVHDESRSVGQLGWRQQAYFHRNRVRFVLRHLPTERFAAEFMPAERKALKEAGTPLDVYLLEQGYSAALALPKLEPIQRGGLERLRQGAVEERLSRFERILTPPPPIVHQPLTSSVPVLGPLIAWFRNLWNTVSARWYVRLMMDQQEAVNQQVRDHFQAVYDQLNLLLHELERQQQAVDTLQETSHAAREHGAADPETLRTPGRS